MIEAIRQVGLEQPENRVCYIHVTLLPFISGSKEVKSKPTQHSVKDLQTLGIQPDILVCRSDIPIPEEIIGKLSMFCNVKRDCVIENSTVSNLYEAPLMLEKNGLAHAVCRKLNLKNKEADNNDWAKMIDKIKKIKEENKVTIAICGKYTQLEDSYLSVTESLKHGGFANNVNVEVKFIDTEKLNAKNVKETLKPFDGIVVPGGFGMRGIEGMIQAIKYARENKMPFLGICLGMQMAVIEFARDVLKLKDVNSEEFDEKCKNPVIHIMDDQKTVKKKGGTMRLGAYPCILKKGSYAHKIYGQDEISERHRHRFEYNNDYREMMEEAGLNIVGTSPSGLLVEMVEIKDHPFFVAGQFHPEFKSRPDKPAPLFKELIKKAKEYHK